MNASTLVTHRYIALKTESQKTVKMRRTLFFKDSKWNTRILRHLSPFMCLRGRMESGLLIYIFSETRIK